MSEINSKLKYFIISKIEEDLSNKVVYPVGNEIWILDLDNKKWFVSVTSDGYLWYNNIFFKTHLSLFSLENRTLSNILKEWFEKLFKVRIKASSKKNTDSEYFIETLLSKKNEKKWELNKRYGFSYEVVEEFVTNRKKNSLVLVENYLGVKA